MDRLVVYNQNEYSGSEREVKQFTLQGSNDNSTWTTIIVNECGKSNATEPNPGWSFRLPDNWDDDDEGRTWRYWKFIMNTFHGSDSPYGGVMEIELYGANDSLDDELSTSSLVAKDVYSETGNFGRGITVGYGYGGENSVADGAIIEVNVGIGITNPGYRLDVFSTSFPSARIRSSYTSSSKEFTSLLFGLPSLNSGSQIGYVYDTITPANSYFHITPYGRGEGDDFSVNASGNVGIGAITPDVRLHINGANAYPATSGTTPTGFIALRNTAGATHGAYIGVANAAPWGTWIQAQDKNNLGTSYPILLNPNGGNVGIGTINTTTKLDVRGDTQTYGLRLLTDTTNQTDTGNIASSATNISYRAYGGFQSYTAAVTCNNTWYTLFPNFNYSTGYIIVTAGDATSKNVQEYVFMTTAPAYGIGFVTQLHSHGSWNTGSFELQLSSSGGNYTLQARATSYYSSSNVSGIYIKIISNY